MRRERDQIDFSIMNLENSVNLSDCEIHAFSVVVITCDTQTVPDDTSTVRQGLQML